MDAARFFRIIDRAVLEHYSHPSGLQLILAALPEHHLFHHISRNPLGRAGGIRLNPDSILPQTMESTVEILEQVVDVSGGAFYRRKAARVLAREGFGAGSEERYEHIFAN